MKSYYIFLFFVLNSLSFQLVGQQDEIYKIVEEMPSFGSCVSMEDTKERKACSDKEALTFLMDNIVYPTEASNKGTEGTVVVSFIIDKEGNLTEPKVVKDIGDGCGDEALRILKTMKGWRPGKQKGEIVNVQMYLPIKFRVIPVKIRSERFEVFPDLICENFLTEFVKLNIVHEMADDKLPKDKLCNAGGIKNYIKTLKIVLDRNGNKKEASSESGAYTETMKGFFRDAQVNDVIELEYVIAWVKDGVENSKKIYKSIIVE